MQPTPVDVEAAKRQGWREQHILVVSHDDERLDFLERQLIRSIGERLYGCLLYTSPSPRDCS